MHRPIPGFTFRPVLKGRIHRHKTRFGANPQPGGKQAHQHTGEFLSLYESRTTIGEGSELKIMLPIEQPRQQQMTQSAQFFQMFCHPHLWTEAHGFCPRELNTCP